MFYIRLKGKNVIKKIAVIGQGYVGLPLAYEFWLSGLPVVGFDIDAEKVKNLSEGRSHIEDVSDVDIREMLDRGGYLPTASREDLAGCDVFIVTVPTPLTEHGEPSLEYVIRAAQIIAPFIRGKLVVLESTVAPGTTEGAFAEVFRTMLDFEPDLDYFLAFSPERIDPGNKNWALANTPKVVAGFSDVSLGKVETLYRGICTKVHAASSIRVAEMSKLLENTFRHVNIALVNELARHAHTMGIDIWDVIDMAETKPYGFMKFTPGVGVGGHCIPIDPAYLAKSIKHQTGETSRFIELAYEVNETQPVYVAGRVAEVLNTGRKSVNGSRILVVGYTYKPNTADARETPVQDLIAELNRQGAHVDLADQYVWQSGRLMDGVTVVNLENVGLSSFYELYDMVVITVNHSGQSDLYNNLTKADVPVLDCTGLGIDSFIKL